MNMTKISRQVTAVLALAAMLFTTACSDGDDPAPTDPGQSTSAGGDGDQPTEEPGTILADGLYFFPPVEGAELVTSETSAEGDAENRATVVSIQADGDGQIVTVDKVIRGNTESSGTFGYTTGKDGSVQIDVDAFLLTVAASTSLPGMTAEAVGDDVVIPSIAELENGVTSTGTVAVEMSAEGVNIRNETTYTIRGAGYESVTVPLGTFDAYVVELDLQVKSSLGASGDGLVRYWFVPGFARVRQETNIVGHHIVGELVSSTVTP